MVEGGDEEHPSDIHRDRKNDGEPTHSNEQDSETRNVQQDKWNNPQPIDSLVCRSRCIGIIITLRFRGGQTSSNCACRRFNSITLRDKAFPSVTLEGFVENVELDSILSKNSRNWWWPVRRQSLTCAREPAFGTICGDSGTERR